MNVHGAAPREIDHRLGKYVPVRHDDRQIRLQPRAKSAGVVGERGDAIVIRVTAPPVDGKANAAIAKLLAATWQVPKTRLRLTAGATDRRKFFVLEGDPAVLAARLQGWLTQWTERQ